MRRGLAGLLFFVAAACLALAAGGWWLEHVAFDTADAAATWPTSCCGTPTSAGRSPPSPPTPRRPRWGSPPTEVRPRSTSSPRPSPGAELIGRSSPTPTPASSGCATSPVQITGGPARGARPRPAGRPTCPPVTLPVQEVAGPRARSGRRCTGPCRSPPSPAGSPCCSVSIAHPRKADAVFGIGVFCIVAAVAALVLGYVVPVSCAGTRRQRRGSPVIPAMAAHSLPVRGRRRGRPAGRRHRADDRRRRGAVAAAWSTPCRSTATPTSAAGPDTSASCRPPDRAVGWADGRLSGELGDELAEDVGVAGRVVVGVHHRDQPLLVEARRQQHASVDAVDPLGEGEVEVGRLVVAVVADRRRATT